MLRYVKVIDVPGVPKEVTLFKKSTQFNCNTRRKLSILFLLLILDPIKKKKLCFGK